MSTACIIIARGGSKGLPGKNIIPLAGKPLVRWTIDSALSSSEIDSVWVSTDCDKIAKIAELSKCNIIRRPPEFSSDSATSESAWLHAIDFIESSSTIDTVVAPQATSPFRLKYDFNSALRIFRDGGYNSLLSVCKEEDCFLWGESESGFRPINYEPFNRRRRQDITATYRENGSFYIFEVAGFKSTGCRLFGDIGIYEMPRRCSFQIDQKEDLLICNALMKEFIHEI